MGDVSIYIKIKNKNKKGIIIITHQVENRHFHHTLVEICGLILDDLDGNDLLRFKVLALDDLSKSSLTQHIQNKVSVSSLMVSIVWKRTGGE